MSPPIIHHRNQRGKPMGKGSTVPERCNASLLYEPGTGWSYRTSMDWAGGLIERLTGRTLQNYVDKYIWEPLGTTNITFWPKKHAELKAKTAHMASRSNDGSGKVVNGSEVPSLDEGAEDCVGGHGTYASMRSFFKILQSVFANNGRLLKEETVEMIFESQLTQKLKK